MPPGLVPPPTRQLSGCGAQPQICPEAIELRSKSEICLPMTVSPWGRQMQAVMGIVVGWIVISLALGPLLTWAFFYPLRRERAAHDRQAVGEIDNAGSLPTLVVTPGIAPVAEGLSA